MTDEEIKEKATEWIRSQGWSEENLPNDEYVQMCDAYIAGAKENRTVWHDLIKDPNDLPTQTNTGISDYVITDRGVGYYNGRVKSWWVKNDYALTDKVIAWCETPKFEGE